MALLNNVRQSAIKWLKNMRFSSGEESKQITVWVGRRPILMTVAEYARTEAHKKDVNLAVAVRLISNALASLPFVLEEKIRKDNKYTWQEVEDHPAKDIFEEPNPFNDPTDISKHFIQALIVDGNSYDIIAKQHSLVPNELWPIPLGMMAPSFSKATGLPDGFVYDPYNKKIRYDYDEILHVKLYDAATPFIGGSMIPPIDENIRSNMSSMKFNRKFFENGASPDYLFVNETGIGMDEEEAEKFIASWEERHKGSGNAHKAGLLPTGYKPHKTSDSIKDLAFAEGIRLNREQIYALLGIPPSEGGVMEYSNYANALIQKRSYWENTLIPFIALVAGGINRQILRQYWRDDDLRIRLDTKNVRALKEDRLIIAKEDSLLTHAGIKTINEVRAERDLDPVDWGDEDPRLHMTGPGIGDRDEGDNSGTGKNSIEIGGISFNTTAETSIVHTPEQARRWKAFDARSRKYEGPYIKIIIRYWKDQRGRVLKGIKAATGDGLAMSLLKLEIDKMEAFADGDLPKKASQIFDLDEENKKLIDAIKLYITAKVSEVGIDTINELNLAISWDAKNPDVLKAIDDIFNRSKYMNDSTFDDIKKMLKVAYDEGQSAGELARNIKTVYGEYGSKRVMTVARTEMGSVVNGGSHLAHLQAEIKEQWLTSLDGRERTSPAGGHQAAHGQIRDAKDKFDVGGEKLDYPLDPNGSAWNVINCRCTVAGIVDTETEN